MHQAYSGGLSSNAASGFKTSYIICRAHGLKKKKVGPPVQKLRFSRWQQQSIKTKHRVLLSMGPWVMHG